MKYLLLIILFSTSVFTMQQKFRTESSLRKNLYKGKREKAKAHCCSCVCLAGEILIKKVAQHGYGAAGFVLENISHGLDPERKFKTE